MVGASIFHFARGLAARKFFTTSICSASPGSRSSSGSAAARPTCGAPRHRAVVRRGPPGRRLRRARRGDLRRADGRPDLGGHPGARPDAPRRRAAGLAGHRHPVELASIIARRLGLTGALGTVAESVDGVYTGRLVGEILHGPAKAHAVRALAASEGLNLRRCTAYSDSVNDVPMLSAVGTAVAVNPDSELRDIAKARGWQIRDFRTGRKAAKIGVPSVLGAGALAGAVAAGVAYRRR